VRTRWIFYFAWLAAVFSACPRLVAQFQEPTQAELKMTSDPMAPGADAVYLDVSEVDNNPDHSETYHARIKVLRQKGENLATVRIPYTRGSVTVTKIEARTIHSDGTVIPLTAKPSDIEYLKTKGLQVNAMVITLPSAEVGCILEYSYELRYITDDYSAPTWEIQRPYLIHQAHFLYIPSSFAHNLMWWQKLPTGMSVQENKKGRFELNLTDVPAVPDEEWMPPIESFLYKVIFYFGTGGSTDVYWKPTIAEWRASADKFAEPTREIHNAVDGLVTPGDSDEVKARKLYVAVQALENTNFTREKDKAERKKLKEKEIKVAQGVWTRKSGNRQEIALLYLAMLRAAGLKAYAMRVVDRDKGLFSQGYFSYGQLDDTLVLVVLNGKEVVTDPGEKMCPFREVSWTHSMAGGIREDDQGGSMAVTPMQQYGNNKLVRTGAVNVDAHGKANGELTFTMTGQDALRWRQAALLNDLTEVKKQFNNWAEAMVPNGMQVNLQQFSALDNDDVPLTARLEVHGILGTSLSKRLLLPGIFFDTRGHRPFVGRERRVEPVDMHYGQEISDRVVYLLPAGMQVEASPQDTKVEWQGHAVVLAHTAIGPGEVTRMRTFARGFTMAKPEEYKDLRAFYQEVAAADQVQIVLKAAVPQKGS